MYFRINTRNGFTLIELLVVIAIIGVLASVVLASLNSAREKARNASYAAQIKEYQKALAIYYSNNGTYPGTATWGCAGQGYPGNSCWSSSYTDENATAAAFRSGLAPYIDSNIIPGPINTSPYRGAMYRATNSGQGYDFILMYEGDLSTCPVGTKTPHSAYVAAGVTRCDLFGQGM